METEIYMDLSLKHYPLRDYRSMWNEMNSIVRDHDKLGRNGKFLDENQQPTEEFSEFLDELQKRPDYAKENTDLPEVPDAKQIDDFVASVHERIVRGEV